MKEFSAEELDGYNGENGKPAYVAYRGDVYDVSNSKLWRNGLHMKRHHAGQDLTTDIQAASHEPVVLERYPKVGTLKKEVDEQQLPAALAALLKNLPCAGLRTASHHHAYRLVWGIHHVSGGKITRLPCFHNPWGLVYRYCTGIPRRHWCRVALRQALFEHMFFGFVMAGFQLGMAYQDAGTGVPPENRLVVAGRSAL